jgi:hypothetical protein
VTHPYATAPDHRFWRRAVARLGDGTDPILDPPAVQIGAEDRVMTAGSCFAQQISRRLRAAAFHFLVTERAHPIVPAAVAEHHNYDRFTARYGNIYTSRQLLQLLRRAYGRFAPSEDIWQGPDGSFVDPFRPQIQPGGFASRREYDADRAQHFAAVRRAFEQADVFIFTFGLTEAWHSAEDDAVFPLCPGVAGGTFDPHNHLLHNHDVEDIVRDFSTFIAELRAINPAVRIILTVSPIPIIATATDDHVLAASTYTKSVLRVAAGMIARRHEAVAYFPSYEVVTGPQTRGRYFAEDLRSLTDEGMDRVMGLFFSHMVAGGGQAPSSSIDEQDDRQTAFAAEARKIVEVLCDEEMLDQEDVASQPTEQSPEAR